MRVILMLNANKHLEIISLNSYGFDTGGKKALAGPLWLEE